MSDLPVIFSGPMVRALLDGRKSQTRRVIEPEPANSRPREGSTLLTEGAGFVRQVAGQFRPRWRKGDRLWVRENCRAYELPGGQDCVLFDADNGYTAIANTRDAADRWLALHHYGVTEKRSQRGRLVPSIHMPRWASRLTLIVTDVRVQRLQEISEEDAVAEGAPDFGAFCEASDPGARNLAGETAAETASRLRWPQRWYSALWNDLHGPDAWAANPWVAAISFDCHRANIDALAPAATLDIAGAA